MAEKFTYYEFITYLVPGVAFLSAARLAVRGFTSDTSPLTGNTIIDSIMFLVLAYITGHFLQLRGRYGLEPKIKTKFWNGAWVSQQYLVAGNKFCSPEKRNRYIRLAIDQDIFTKQELTPLEIHNPQGEAQNKAYRLSQDIYRTYFTAIRDRGKGDKAQIANTYYAFFRGLVVTSVYAATLLLGAAPISIFFLHIPWYHRVPDAALGLFLIYLAFNFRKRAADRGEIHVREVFDSYLALFANS